MIDRFLNTLLMRNLITILFREFIPFLKRLPARKLKVISLISAVFALKPDSHLPKKFVLFASMKAL